MSATHDPHPRDPKKRPDTGPIDWDHTEGDPRLTELAAGLLDSAAEAALRAEIAADPALQRQWQALAETWRMFDALPPVSPTPTLEQSVLAQVRQLATTATNTNTSTSANGAAQAAAAGAGAGVDSGFAATAPTVTHSVAVPPSAPSAVSHHLSHSPVPKESAMISRPGRPTPTIWRVGWQFAAPLAAAAALLLVVGIALNPPQQLSPTSDDAHATAGGTAQPTGPVAMGNDADDDNGAPRPLVAPADASLPERARHRNGNANAGAGAGDVAQAQADAGAQGQGADPRPVAARVRVIDADVNEPKSPLGEMVSAPLSPDPLNPASAPLSPDPLNPASVRYRGMDGWKALSANDAITRLNCEIQVEAGRVATFQFGESRLSINGGSAGAIVALVPDPTAGVDEAGHPRGVMVEMLKPAQVFIDAADGETPLGVRTPTTWASVRDAKAEFTHADNGSTHLSVAGGRVEIAGFDRLGEIAQAVVRDGEIATITLLGRPDVRKNLNTNWVGQWAQKAGAKIDPRVELPLTGTETPISTAQRGAVGTLVANDPDYDNVPFVIDSHTVSVEIVDQIAITTVEEVFHNTTDRTLEGVFYFPLPQGASISAFSMWVTQHDGTVKEIQGEWLERSRARFIYDEYKYQRQDPALLEWVEGNQFKMSIFPIFADEKKRIKITYTQILQADGDTVRYVYPLVSEKLRGNPVRHMNLRATVSTGAELAQVGSISHRTTELADAPHVIWSGGFQADNYVPGRDFIIDYKIAETAGAFYTRASKIGSEAGHVAGFFTPRFEAVAQRRNAGRVIFLVDTSGSMNNDHYDLQLALLSQLMGTLSEDDLVNVVTYDYSAAPVLANFVPATREQSQTIVAALAGRLRYGATNLKSAFREAWKLIDPREDTLVVLLGDGIATQGEVRGLALARDIAEMPLGTTDKVAAQARVRVFPVAIGNTIDEAVLNALANDFQGRMIRATRETAPEAVAHSFASAITTPALTNLSVSIDGVAVTNVFPARFPALVSGQQVSFVGRYHTAGRATVTIRGQLGRETKEWSFAVELPETARAEAIGRYWAARAIDGLQARLDAGEEPADEIRAEIVALSQKFSVSSRHTSLLVLERDEEFKRWNIERPAQAVKDMQVSAADEPYILVESFSGSIRVQPEGASEWLSLTEYMNRTNGSNRLSLNTRIAAEFDAATPSTAVVRVVDPTAAADHAAPTEFVVRERTTIRGRDLPGASAVIAEWQAARDRAPADPGVENPDAPQPQPDLPAETETETVSEEFQHRAEQLVAEMKRLHEAWLKAEREHIATMLRDDAEKAIAAINHFEQRVGEFLTTAEQRAALAAQAEKFRALVQSDDDPLVTWALLREYLQNGGTVETTAQDSFNRFRRARGGSAAGREAGREADSRALDSLRRQAPEEESAREEAAENLNRLERRLAESAGNASALRATGGSGGATGAAERRRAGAEAPSFGSSTNDDDAQGGDSATRDSRDNGRPAAPPELRDAAPRPAAPTTASPAPEPNSSATPGNRAGFGGGGNARPARDLTEESPESSPRPQPQPRHSEGDGEDGAWGTPPPPPANDPGSGPADRRNDFSNDDATPPRRSGQGQQGQQPEQQSEQQGTDKGDALAKTIERAQADILEFVADPTVRAALREQFTQSLAEAIGGLDAHRVLNASLVFAMPEIVPTSQLIGAYTDRVVAQLRAIRGPVIGDVQFSPEGARLLGQMQTARAASIRDQQEADRRFVQAATGITVFVLDHSFTMREALTAAQLDALTMADANARQKIHTKFDLARYELLNALGALGEGERFAVLLVARDIEYIRADFRLGLYRNDGFPQGILRANGATMQRIERILNAVRPDDVANLPGVIAMLHQSGLFDKEAPDLGRVAYLITDGWSSWSPDSTGYLPTTGLGNGATLENYRDSSFTAKFIAAQETLPIFVHAVGVGTHDAAYLEKIAHLTGGKYIDTTAGHAGTVKTMADETPMQRVQRLGAELQRTPRNSDGWLRLIRWASSDAVANAHESLREVPIAVWLAWAEVHPSHHIIYEELGEWLDAQGRQQEALRAFSHIVETNYHSAETHRYLGNFYRSASMWEAARDEYRIARNQASHVAITYFNEANVEAHLGNYDAARSLLAEILEKEWPGRHRNIKERATRELLILYQQLQRQAVARKATSTDEAEIAAASREAERWAAEVERTIESSPYDKAGLREFVAADMIVILDWDTDGTDVDLWMLRNGNDSNKCFYSTQRPGWGAYLHEDQTEGFGPEFITMPKATPAEYTVKIHYYSNASNEIRSYCHVKIIVNIGTPAEQVWEHHVKLQNSGDALEIRTVRFTEDGKIETRTPNDAAAPNNGGNR